MRMLNRAKLALRIDGDVFDEEVKSIINACKADLETGGVCFTEDEDPLIVQAIVLYTKAHFGYNDDSERHQRAYEALKISLALSGKYSRNGGEGK